jgi:hypothetical protein
MIGTQIDRRPSSPGFSLTGAAQQGKAPSLTRDSQIRSELITKTQTQLQAWVEAETRLSELRAEHSRPGCGAFDSTDNLNMEIRQLEEVTKADRALQATLSEMQSKGYTLPEVTKSMSQMEFANLQQIRSAWQAAQRRVED